MSKRTLFDKVWDLHTGTGCTGPYIYDRIKITHKNYPRLVYTNRLAVFYANKFFISAGAKLDFYKILLYCDFGLYYCHTSSFGG